MLINYLYLLERNKDKNNELILNNAFHFIFRFFCVNGVKSLLAILTLNEIRRTQR